MLHELGEYPEGSLLVTVMHQSGYDEVHALHVANVLVIDCEGRDDSLESVVVGIL